VVSGARCVGQVMAPRMALAKLLSGRSRARLSATGLVFPPSILSATWVWISPGSGQGMLFRVFSDRPTLFLAAS